jgi:hypothetical protein
MRKLRVSRSQLDAAVLKDRMVFYAFGLKGQLGCYTDWALILVLLNSSLLVNGLSTWLSGPVVIE